MFVLVTLTTIVRGWGEGGETNLSKFKSKILSKSKITIVNRLACDVARMHCCYDLSTIIDKICGKRCHSIPLSPISMLLAAKVFFYPRILSKIATLM